MKVTPRVRYALNAVCGIVMCWALWQRHDHGIDIPSTVMLLALSWNLMVLSYIPFPRRKPTVVVVHDVVIDEDGPHIVGAHTEEEPPTP